LFPYCVGHLRYGNRDTLLVYRNLPKSRMAACLYAQALQIDQHIRPIDVSPYADRGEIGGGRVGRRSVTVSLGVMAAPISI
jgi:hypothetical protein